MWIRSQNKECLVKLDDFVHYFYDDIENEHGIGSHMVTLGVYESKERALEVLDEIQILLKPIIKYEPIVQEEYNPAYTYRHFIKVDDNTEIKELSTFVYQMPEK